MLDVFDIPRDVRASHAVKLADVQDLLCAYQGEPPQFSPIEFAWDLKRQFGASGFRIWRDLMDAFDPFDPGPSLDGDPRPATTIRDRNKFLVTYWKSLDYAEPTQFDRLLVDEIEWQRRRDEENMELDRKLDAIRERLNPMPINVTPAERIPSRRINAATLEGKPIPEREWLVSGLIPAKNVTLLYGDGGTGKSLLALQLAVAKAAGTHFFGRPVTQGRVEFITAEDSLDEMHRRLTDIARHVGVPIGKLHGLHLTSLADEDALLAVPEDGRGGALAVTPLYTEIENLLAQSRPALMICDTLADIFGGNEIIRAQVRQFIGLLRRLALEYSVTLVVLAHPSLAGMDKGTSGSTGWNNSVRSRLYFQRVHDTDGTEPDEDARVLRVGKSNYGRVGTEINMRWQSGVFVPVGASTGGDPLARQAKAERVFLDLLTKYTVQDRPVSVSTGANYAPKLFQSEARAAGVSKRELIDAMGRLLDCSRIRNVPYGPPSRGTKRLVVSPPPSVN